MSSKVVYLIFILLAFFKASEAQQQTLADLVGTSQLSGTTSFLSAVQQNGLLALLNGTGGYNFTVLVPNDAAFNNFQLNDQDLSNVLLYHVILGNHNSSSLQNNQVLNTLAGSWIRVNVYNNADNTTSVVFNGVATVVQADVEASNGIAHVIDQVLSPGSVQNQSQTVWSFLQNDGRFTFLSRALQFTGLYTALNNYTFSPNNSFTLFAPTDDFLNNALGSAVVANLLEAVNNATLSSVLANHVVNETYFAAGLTDGLNLTALSGLTLNIVNNATGVFVNDIQVVQADISLRNGVVHVINGVLLTEGFLFPNGTNGGGNSSTLADLIGTDAFQTNVSEVAQALRDYNLLNYLNSPLPATILVPSNDAVNANSALLATLSNTDLQSLFAKHIVAIGRAILSNQFTNDQILLPPGGGWVRVNVYNNTDSPSGIFFNGRATVIEADVQASNGVAHVIDDVLLPNNETEDNTIFSYLLSDGRFTNLVAALQANNLWRTFNNFSLGAGNAFTFFAPTDEAFNSMKRQTGQPNADVANLLRNHVLDSTYYSRGLTAGQYTTLQGSNLSVDTNNGVTVNGVQVVQPDINVRNGVVHVINQLLPIEGQPQEQPQPSPEPQPEPQPSPEPQPEGNVDCYAITSCVECTQHSSQCTYCSVAPSGSYSQWRGRCVNVNPTQSELNTCSNSYGQWINDVNSCPTKNTPHPQTPTPGKYGNPTPSPTKYNNPTPSPSGYKNPTPTPKTSGYGSPTGSGSSNNCGSYTSCSSCTRDSNCFYCAWGSSSGSCYSRTSTYQALCSRTGKVYNTSCPSGYGGYGRY